MKESNPDNLKERLFDALIQGYQRELATSVVVDNALGVINNWILRFKENDPKDDEDYGYNNAIDAILHAIKDERG